MSNLVVAHPHDGLRREMVEALAAWGHEAAEARTGDEAVRRAVDMDADAVLVSSHLGDRDGRDVCRLLRGCPKGRELGLLMMGPEFWEPGVAGLFVAELAIDGFLAVPCRRSSLRAAVDGVLERFRRATPLPDDGLAGAIEATFYRLDHASYYQLLGAPQDALHETLRECFHRVSMLHHPDRHQALRGSSIYDRVNAIYKRLSEAWNVLSDQRSRARYDAGLARGELRLVDARRPVSQAEGLDAPGAADAAAELAALPDDANARRFFQTGRTAEDSRDFRTARMNYAFALTYAPDNAVLREAVARMEYLLDLRTSTSPPEEPSGPPAQEDAVPEDLPEPLPVHLAIIMDGNGRWAKARGLSRAEGHRAGADAVRTITRACRRWGVRHLTLYAFSEQNWERPEDEVAALMGLLADYARSERAEILDNDIRLEAIGALDKLPAPALLGLQALMAESARNGGMRLCLALSYGGREEIVEAARRAARLARAGELDPEALDPAAFQRLLQRPDVPDPDLVVRTSGELRVSNFLLWQIAYSEFHVTDTPWPDFGEAHLLLALKDYAGRRRRFGRTDEQLDAGAPRPGAGA